MSKIVNKKVPTHAVPAAGSMEIPLSLIVVDNDFNARTQFDEKEMIAFSKSMEEEGQLQDAIVEPMADGKYFLIAGFRRRMAAEILKWDTLRCMVKVSEKTDKKEIEIDRYFTNVAENVARKNLTPYDLAMRCKLLKKKFGISGSQIAKRVGKNSGYINNLLNVVGEGEQGDGVIPEILKRWEYECARPEGDLRSPTCKTDWLNRVRKLDKVAQAKELERQLFIDDGGDPEKFDAVDKAGDKASDKETGPSDALAIRPTRDAVVKALEAVQAKLKDDGVGKEERTRLNGVAEGLKFALGVKSGLTNRIKGIVAFKDGKIVESVATVQAAN